MHCSPRPSSFPLLRSTDHRLNNDPSRRSNSLERLRNRLRRLYAHFAPAHPNTHGLCPHCGTDCYRITLPTRSDPSSPRSSALRSCTTPDIPEHANIRDAKPLCWICWKHHSRFDGCDGVPKPLSVPRDGERVGHLVRGNLGLDRICSSVKLQAAVDALSREDTDRMRRRDLGLSDPHRITGSSGRSVPYWNACRLEHRDCTLSSASQPSAETAMSNAVVMNEWNELIGRLAPRDQEGKSYLESIARPRCTFKLLQQAAFMEDGRSYGKESSSVTTLPDKTIKDKNVGPVVYDTAGGRPAAVPTPSAPRWPLHDAMISYQHSIEGPRAAFDTMRDWSDRQDDSSVVAQKGFSGKSAAESERSLRRPTAVPDCVQQEQKMSDSEFDALPDWSDIEDECVGDGCSDERPVASLLSSEASSLSCSSTDSQTMVMTIMYDPSRGAAVR